MRPLTALTFASVFVALSALPATALPIKEIPKVDKTDMDLIQGTWVLESEERNGQPAPPKSPPLKVTFKGNTVIISEQGGFMSTIKLDPSKTPKAIDISRPKDDTALGIYSIEGDTLKICGAQSGMPRPTGFQSVQGTESFTFKREKRQE